MSNRCKHGFEDCSTCDRCDHGFRSCSVCGSARWEDKRRLTAERDGFEKEKDYYKGLAEDFRKQGESDRVDLAEAQSAMETCARRLRLLAWTRSGEHPVLEAGMLDLAEMLRGVLSRTAVGRKDCPNPGGTRR